jgi:hypothetical protein
MEDSNGNVHPDAIRDQVAGWATGEYIKALRPKLEELDKACANVRRIVFDLRRLLQKE